MRTSRRQLIGKLTVSFVAILLIAVLTLLSGCAGGNSETKTNSRTTTEKGSLAQTGAASKSIVFDSWVRGVQEGVKPVGGRPPVSFEEAEKQIGKKLKLPKETFGGKIDAMYNDTSASGNPQTGAIYSNGLIVGQEVWKEKRDYKAWQSYELKTKAEASWVIGSDGYLVTITGNEGLAYPVYEDSGYKLPPQLYWWDNGIEYYLSAWKLGFTDKQLIKVAESMYTRKNNRAGS